MYKSKKRNNKILIRAGIMSAHQGITLIALIITIILLLILAGVTINLTIGDNGIITVTKKAAIEAKKQDYFEQLRLIILEEQTQRHAITKETLFIESLKEKIQQKTWVSQVIITGETGEQNTVLIINTIDGYEIIIDVWNEELKAEIREGYFEESGKVFRLEKFTIDLNANIDSIKVTITSVNDIQGFLSNNSEVEYRFSKDNGSTWTNYQTDSTYTFKELYGDLSGETYTIVVEARDKKGKTMQLSQTAKTDCLLNAYYRNTANELLLTADGREYKKTNNIGAITGVIFYKGSQNWIKPLLVSKDPAAVEFYTSYSNTSLSYAGSIEYYGTKYYYCSGGESMPASSTYTTTIPVLNNTTNIYSNMEDAARALLDRYFLKTAPRNTANELICTIGDRKFYKTNNKEAIVALIKQHADPWIGPILVSTDQSAVEYYNSYSNSNILCAGSLEYNGTKYYYSNYALEFMPATSTYDTTLPILNENGTTEERILDFISKYY